MVSRLRMRFWRISNYADLAGTGAKKFAGRWNSGGLPMVYLADHPSTALLETIVHFEREALPHTFQLLAIDVDDIGDKSNKKCCCCCFLLQITVLSIDCILNSYRAYIYMQ